MISHIGYTGKVLDPWFRATSTNNSYLTNSTSNYIVAAAQSYAKLSHYPDRLNSVLGCTEQYQFCNTTLCSAMGGINANFTNPYFGLVLNDDQKAIFDLIYTGISRITISTGVYILGDDLLLAKEKVWSEIDSLSSPLPDDQWEKEAVNIVNVMLSALQGRIMHFASPPNITLKLSKGTVSSLDFVTAPQTEAEKQTCNIVRIRDAAYYNFKVPGLILVLALGLVIIFINIFCVPGLVFWVRRKVKRSEHPRDEWYQTSLLRLYSTAVEKNGIGPWDINDRWDIPYSRTAGVSFTADRAWQMNDETSNLMVDTNTAG